MRELKDFYRRYKFAVWPALSAVISVAVVITVIIPQFLGFLKGRDELKNIYDKTLTLQAKELELAEVDENRINESLQLAYTVLPKNRDIPEAATLLKNLAEKNGLSVKNLGFSGSSLEGTESTFQLNIGVVGTLSIIKQFLNDLKISGRLLQTGPITLYFERQSEGIEAEIPLTVYYDNSTDTVQLLTDQPIAKLNDADQRLLEELTSGLGAIVPVVREPQTSSLTESEKSVLLGKENPFE